MPSRTGILITVSALLSLHGYLIFWRDESANVRQHHRALDQSRLVLIESIAQQPANKIEKALKTQQSQSVHEPSSDFITLDNASILHGIQQKPNTTLIEAKLLSEKERQGMYSCTLPDGKIVEMQMSIFPALIIAGTQKAGTSSLGNILSTHPNLTRSIKNEPHFFDFRFARKVNTSDEPTLCELRWEYYHHFPQQNDSIHGANSHYWTFETTPAYMVRKYVPAMIHKLMDNKPLPKPKIIMILRDPVERAFSEFSMMLGTVEKELPTFEDKIAFDIRKLAKQRITTAPPLDPHVSAENWTQRPLSHFALPTNVDWRQTWLPTRQSQIAKGLYAYQIHLWLPYFALNKELLVINYDTYQQKKEAVLNQIIRFIHLPPYTFSKSILEKDHSPQAEKIRIPWKNNATRVYLQRFYAPYNALLEGLLGHEWKNVWQYSL